MLRALYALAQGCPLRTCLAGALLLLTAPAVWAGTSNQPNPVVSFATPGIKQVTLRVCNSGGCSSVTRDVTVLDPRPVVTGASLAPSAVETGQLVLFTGAGTGKPPLAYTWQVTRVGGPLVATLQGASVWWNTSGVPPGSYTVSLQIQNGTEPATSSPLSLTLAAASAHDFYSVTPCRIYDSRLTSTPLLSGVARTVQVTGLCGIPAEARAVAANVSVIAPTGTGYGILYPGNYPQPATSTINFVAGLFRSNHAILPLATNGAGTLTSWLTIAGVNGSAHLAIDVSGYYRN